MTLWSGERFGAWVAATVATLVLAAGPTADAHSWYPWECCNDHDCKVADAVVRDGAGHLVVISGNRRITVPDTFPTRPSPDAQAHFCYTDEPEGGLICLFLPNPS